MITRVNVSCNICTLGFALRVTIATQTGQQHTFKCPSCSSLLKYAFEFKNEQSGGGETFVNCTKQGSDTFHSKVINLHPDFLIPEDKLHDPEFSVNMYMMELALEVFEVEEMDGIVDSDAVFEYWKIIKIEWDLLDNKKDAILLMRYQDDGLIAPNETVEDVFYKRLIEFLLHLNCFQPDVVKGLNVILLDAVEKNRGKVEALLAYYQNGFFNQQIKLYKKSLEKFFDGYADLRQLRFPIQLNTDFSNHIITNYNYSTVDKIYSENFEILAKVISGIGFIMKVSKGKDFDVFERIDLDGYLNSSLQNKIKHLSTVADDLFVPEASIINNDLRNASSHGDMRLHPERLSIQCSHGGNNFEVRYLDYLKLCWEQMDYIGQLAIHDIKMRGLIETIKKIPQGARIVPK